MEDRLARRANQEEILQTLVREQGIQAFPAVVVSSELHRGIESLVQCHGLGALRPNTVMLGWPGGDERAPVFGGILHDVAALGCSLVAVRFPEEPVDPWIAPRGTLDVWWRGRQNGELMLLLTFLLTTNPDWRGHRIRLLRVIENEAGRAEVLAHLGELIESSRIDAEPRVIVSDDPLRAIHDASRHAALVFMGFEAPGTGDELIFFHRMEALAGPIERVVFVDSVGGMSQILS